MENIKTDEGVEVVKENYAPAEEIEKNLFSTYVEADMLVAGLEKLTWLCFNFSPASIEIIDPVDFHYKGNQLQNWINDLLAKLHELGSMSKQVASQNKLLVNNMNRLIKNNILMCAKIGKDTPKEIEEMIGIPYKQLQPFFEALVKEGKIKVDKDKIKRLEERTDKKSEKKKASKPKKTSKKKK